MSAAVWKHIGLHGHSVGTFTADKNGIQWKSAVGGGNDDDVYSSRLLPAKTIVGAKWTVFGRSGHVRIRTSASDPHRQESRFDGFPHSDFDRLRDALRRLYDVDLTKHSMSSAGCSFGNTDIEDGNMAFRQCVLEDADEEGEEFEPRDGDEMMSVNLTEVSQCVLPGNNRNEIEVQFHESDAVEAGTDQLVAIRFYIPPDPDADPSEQDAPTPAELFQQRIMKNANIKRTTGDVIVEFDEVKGTFLTPRGRYSIELYGNFFRMRGAKYDYKIKYDDINRLFLLPKPDEVHMAFVIALDKPIRQGQQRYQNLVLQTNKEHAEVTVNLDEETLEKEYGGDLQPVMYGALSNLVAKTFKIVAKKKVFIPGKFANANQQPCVKCALKASEGHLYPLEKQFIFIHKPTVLVRFDDVESVEFQRYAGGQGSTRNFDLCVALTSEGDSSSAKEYIFSGIDRSDYTGLYNFLSGKKIKIKNLQAEGGTVLDERPTAPLYNEDVIYGTQGAAGSGMLGGEEEESSEDESYGTNDDEEPDSESISESDDDLGSDFDESDLEEHRRAAGVERRGKSDEGGGKEKEKRKKADGGAGAEAEVPKKRKKKRSGSDDGSGNEEEASKASSKRSGGGGEASPKKKAKKKKKDPNAPKRGASAYMFYSNAVRADVQKENPDAKFTDMGKLIGKRWKELGDGEKQKYEEMAANDKVRYQKEMENYSAPSDNDDESGEDAAKPKKKRAKKDPNAPKRNQTSWMFFNKMMRSKMQEQNPGASFSELGKLTSEAWKKCTPEEKEKYEEMAKKDKARFKQEMENYSAPSDVEEEEEKKPPKKGKKDPNAPKRGKSAYMCFSMAVRSKVKEQNPSASFGELGKLIGQAWGDLPEDQKVKYEEMAKKDDERYKREMKDYVPPEDSGGEDDKKAKAKASKKPKAKGKKEESEEEKDSDDDSSGSDSSGSSDDSDDSGSDSD